MLKRPLARALAGAVLAAAASAARRLDELLASEAKR